MDNRDIEIKKLRSKRGSTKAKLTVFKNYVSKCIMAADSSTINLTEFRSRLTRAENLLDEFNDIQSEIEGLLDDIDGELEERELFENSFYITFSQASDFLESNRSNHDSGDCSGQGSDRSNGSLQENNSQNSNVSAVFSEGATRDRVTNDSSDHLFGVKLPTINLPVFQGNTENWLEFRDAFDSLIIQNQKIGDYQRLVYLRASLEGEALETIASLKVSSENFRVAWELLCDSYTDKRSLLHEHTKALFEIEALQKESSSGLKHICDHVNKNMRSLHNLGEPTDKWDTLIIFMIINKLDTITRREWESAKFPNNANGVPALKDLLTFLKDKSNVLKKMEIKFIQPGTSQTKSKMSKDYYKRDKQVTKSFISNNRSCALCEKSHKIYICPTFLKMNVNQRIDTVKKLKLCINCLNGGHRADKCNYGNCKVCSSKHNSLLHIDTLGTASTINISEGSNSLIENSLSSITFSQDQILLSTIQVRVVDFKGNSHTCRALLDSGSQSNFITSEFCNILGLERQSVDMTVIGITKVSSTIKYKTSVKIHSLQNAFSASLPCLIVPNISESIPNGSFDSSTLNIPQNIQLADPDFNITKPIHLLIGSGLFWQVLSIGQIRLGPSLPMLQKTKFGWIVAGSLNLGLSPNISKCHFAQDCDVQEQLARFWEIENFPTDRVLSQEEQACEYSFTSSHERDSNGRFIVSIPLKESVDKLGDSKLQALKRFHNLESRLQRNDRMRQLYINFMTEYLELGHMSLIDDNAFSNVDPYYLCHHGVLKEQSTTTKLRVVFDGSCPTSSGWSLNDLQLVGPNIQSDLFDILLRFRQYTYVVSADVCKMYRQVLVKPEQRFLQTILWRSDPSEPLRSYQLNTVTYGTASAAFLSIRSLHQLALENKNLLPTASNIIKTDFYVDDLLTGSDSLDHLSQLCHDISSILKQGCFYLRKWISNDLTVLDKVENSSSDLNFLQLGCHESSKTLGLSWCLKSDALFYQISDEHNFNRVTKRSMLSSIAQIYDPLGLLSPCTIVAKILLQRLWLEKLTWDESVPQDIHSRWVGFRNELHIINDLRVTRAVKCLEPICLELHSFSDASEDAYGGCIYIRSVDKGGNVLVNLLCAKTKVAPIKRTTLPRLELCGALISARLANRVLQCSRQTYNKIYHWSDSTIVLGWIKTSSHLLKTFVSNRVAEIQSKTCVENWHHVSGKLNPADLLSRGVQPSALEGSSIWWHGPDFLSRPVCEWPLLSQPQVNDLPEMKANSFISLGVLMTDSIPINRFSSLQRLKHSIAYCLRFIRNCKVPKELRNAQPVCAKELQEALLAVVRLVQRQHFSSEYLRLSQNKSINSNSKVLRLCPFLDNQAIVRVGGRLKLSDYDFTKQHPILLPSDSHLTTLIFRDMHHKLLHAGPQQLLYSIREQFWPISGRNLARKTVHDCICCFKAKPRFGYPLMGELPRDRITPSLPFSVSGVDYCGPFILKDRRSRGFKTHKSWVSLFICLTTKAIHLEIATDLTKDAFMAAFRRFCARRGKPSKMLSDNGTNFVGAKNELDDLTNFLKQNENDLTALHAFEGTDWKFIPPYSPHFGGLWEAGVKGVKKHLKRVLGKSLLVYEDFQTILLQVEAVLNSRPLFPSSSDPNDLSPITPSHFLIGRTLTSPPNPDVLEIKESRLGNYERLQQLQQHIWKRWSTEYLSELQQRSKWSKDSSRIKINSMVLLKDNNAPSMCWSLGRVIAVHPGKDNVIRVVSVKTSRGIFRRAVTTVCPLPEDND